MSDEPPVLIACSHGTAVAAGRASIARLRLAIAAGRPGLEVVPAFVDVQAPRLTNVVRRLCDAGRSSVVVPLLLSTGYHVKTDIGRVVDAGAGRVRAAGPLGENGALAPLLAKRLSEAGAKETDAVVVAAAGSSDPAAAADLLAVTERLAAARSGPTVGGYVTKAGNGVPTVADAVSDLRRRGSRRVIVASYLLAPGTFQARLGSTGADGVSRPLGHDRLLVARALAGYDRAVAVGVSLPTGSPAV